MSARRAKPLASCFLPHTLPLCLNSAVQGLNPTSAMWCLFPTKVMPHPLPTNNQQSLYKGTTHVMSNKILCLLLSLIIFLVWSSLFFFYVYFQIILPDLEHLIHHRLDSTISKTLEMHLRETSHPISTSTFKVVLNFRVFFVCFLL